MGEGAGCRISAKTFWRPGSKFLSVKAAGAINVEMLNVCDTAYLLLQFFPQLRKQHHLNLLQFLDDILVRQIDKITQSEGVEAPKLGKREH